MGDKELGGYKYRGEWLNRQMAGKEIFRYVENQMGDIAESWVAISREVNGEVQIAGKITSGFKEIWVAKQRVK